MVEDKKQLIEYRGYLPSPQLELELSWTELASWG